MRMRRAKLPRHASTRPRRGPPWSPSGEDRWDRKWAGHLYRRAAFGATWAELQAAVDAGPGATIDRLLAGGEGQAEFDRLMDDLGPDDPQFQGQEANEAGSRTGGSTGSSTRTHPLRERLVLFWHNHFATSVLKVRQPALMKQQNILIRKHALGKFGPFLLEMSRDPAMLIWLDSNSNARGKPNENYAREVMELFTLGVGHYTEADVREAARAFTGWHTDGRKFTFNRSRHDDGTKTVLGQTGDWDGGDVVRIVLEQPAAARFLVRKLYRDLIGEGETPPDALLAPLAERYRASGYDTADLVGTMLRSRHFFSEHAYRRRVKSPVEYVVGMLRCLEAKTAPAAGIRVAATAPADGRARSVAVRPAERQGVGGRRGVAQLGDAPGPPQPRLEGRPGRRRPPAASGPTRRPSSASTPTRRDAEGGVDFLLDLLLQPAAGEVADEARREARRVPGRRAAPPRPRPTRGCARRSTRLC